MKLLRRILISIWLPIAIIALWSLSVVVISSPFFPAPLRIAQAFQENWLFSRFASDVVPSIITVFGGYFSALIVGVVVGFLLGLAPRLEWIVDPVLQFMRSLPALAIIPLILVIGGIGIQSKLFIVALGAFWPILLNTIDGVRSVDPEITRMAAVYRVPLHVRLAKIVFPGALPQIMAGARVSLAMAFVLMVGSELYAANRGIGYFILQSQQSFAITDMWSGIILLGILGYVFSALFSAIERRVVFWTR
jgi:sulfonate transport system permease protein